MNDLENFHEITDQQREKLIQHARYLAKRHPRQARGVLEQLYVHDAKGVDPLHDFCVMEIPYCDSFHRRLGNMPT